eukprot:scaffold888_cov569-Prasinococcus_capsulatus_cf.AAC.9
MKAEVDPDSSLDPTLIARFKTLLQEYAHEAKRTDLMSPWRAGLSHLGRTTHLRFQPVAQGRPPVAGVLPLTPLCPSMQCRETQKLASSTHAAGNE